MRLPHIRIRSVLPLLSAAVLAGCATFRCSQTDSFVDDDGNRVHVEYGQLSKPRAYTMVSPANGKTITCTSTAMVRVELPSGERVDCYTCQNAFSYGTMYESADRKWKYLTTGLECAVYLENEDKTDYLLVFKGTAFQDERSGAGSTR